MYTFCLVFLFVWIFCLIYLLIVCFDFILYVSMGVSVCFWFLFCWFCFLLYLNKGRKKNIGWVGREGERIWEQLGEGQVCWKCFVWKFFSVKLWFFIITKWRKSSENITLHSIMFTFALKSVITDSLYLRWLYIYTATSYHHRKPFIVSLGEKLPPFL